MISKRVLWVGACALALAGSARAQAELFTFAGPGPYASLGSSVAAAGDVDLDGFGDVLAGAFTAGFPAVFTGMARVYSGRDGGLLHTWTGASLGAEFGIDVAGFGDLDQDGHPDLAVGARSTELLGQRLGNIRIFSGQSGAVLKSWYGDQDGCAFGHALGAAGDIDQDGVPDLIAGAPRHSAAALWAGRVTAVSGSTGLTLFAWYGGEVNELFGSAVASADVDQDGVPDVIIGAPMADAGGIDRGRVVVYSGKTGVLLRSFAGDAAGDRFGEAVSGGGRVNQDAAEDVVAGAPYHDGTGPDAGRVKVLSGATGTLIFLKDGAAGGDRLGASVGGGADINQDGFADVVMGAPGTEGPNVQRGTDQGALRVCSGKDAAVLLEVAGPTAYAEFGHDVAFAGFVNGDAHADIVVGAWTDPTGGPAAGSVSVLSGTCGSSSAYGTGCPGSGGFTPLLLSSGCFTPGGKIAFTIVNGLGGALPALAVGAAPGNTPLAGACSLLVSPVVLTVPLPPLQNVGPGMGSLLIPTKLPGITPAPVTLTVQAFLLDPGAPQGFAATGARMLTIP